MSFLDGVMLVVGVIGALLASVYYALESLVISLVPRKFRRKDVKGQVALVTGGGSGIGRLVCLKLAARGARVVTWDVNAAGNEETVGQVAASGGECYAYTVDLCDRKAIYAVAAKVKRDVGKVDILVNNAGIVTGKNFQEAPDELIQKTFDVNIMSHFWTTKAFLGDMLASNKGHIVTIASVAGLAGVNKLADYCASKFAAVGFDESLRLELMVEGYTGVKTTVICPYYISTGMFEGVKSKVIPILQPEFVASEIVDGILLNRVIVVLPSFCRILILLKYILPQKAIYIFGRASGITCAMDEFVGRQKFD
ncbi:short-chain dehydrogenase/reductase family 16C member 6 isoform X2 [Procambarus clarkii]|uniref:short-chain dehydrogenase/reductase family 16C member 6 isoform X2 n=1 Tax=Procambarus clarkii TaxID=6728 RepID=UPI001E67122B|nr:short-chain dehydrogenase/reductase family 16C member 6-like isoform X2 [Procambarus clarkii]